jgi:hypothetical protein
MKKLILGLVILIVTSSCHTKPAIDLEKITFKENINTLLLGHIKNPEPLDVWTLLPHYVAFKLDGFGYGPFRYEGRGDPDHLHFSSLSFLVNSFRQNKVVGYVLSIGTTDEARELTDYIMKKNGKPIELASKPKPDKDGLVYGFNSFLWKDIRPGFSLILATHYHTDHDKQLFSTEVIMLQNDQTAALNRAIGTFTTNR